MINKWTQSEIDILKDNYPKLGKFGFSELLPNRTPESIATRARLLGIKHKTIWSAEEENILKEFYPTKGREYCAELLKREVKTITQKANRLGLRRDNQYGKWTHKEYDRALMEAEIEAYPIEEYKGYGIPILHSCLEGHTWSTRPNTLLSYKTGCPQCSDSSFKIDKPAILYYIKICNKGKTYYKVGVTNRTVQQRFPTSIKFITILKETKFKVGKDALEHEKLILSTYKDKRVTVSDLLVERGNTELFEEDVLKLDK